MIPKFIRQASTVGYASLALAQSEAAEESFPAFEAAAFPQALVHNSVSAMEGLIRYEGSHKQGANAYRISELERRLSPAEKVSEKDSQTAIAPNVVHAPIPTWAKASWKESFHFKDEDRTARELITALAPSGAETNSLQLSKVRMNLLTQYFTQRDAEPIAIMRSSVRSFERSIYSARNRIEMAKVMDIDYEKLDPNAAKLRSRQALSVADFLITRLKEEPTIENSSILDATFQSLAGGMHLIDRLERVRISGSFFIDALGLDVRDALDFSKDRFDNERGYDGEKYTERYLRGRGYSVSAGGVPAEGFHYKSSLGLGGVSSSIRSFDAQALEPRWRTRFQWGGAVPTELEVTGEIRPFSDKSEWRVFATFTLWFDRSPPTRR